MLNSRTGGQTVAPLPLPQNVPSATDETNVNTDTTYRWIVLACIFVASAISVVDRIAWGNVSTFYAQAMGTSVAALGGFFTAFYIGYFVTNALSGFGADWFGGRRMLVVSMLMLAVVTAGFSFTRSVAMGLVVQCAMGLVAGMDYSACVRLLSDVFPPERKTTAMGLFLSSIPAGVALSNLFVPTLTRLVGWEDVYRIIGALVAATGIVAYFVLGSRSEELAHKSSPASASPKTLFGNRGFRIAAVAGFGQQWGIWGFAFWSNALLIKGHHIDPVKAGFIIAVFGVLTGVAKPVAGWLADRVRIQKPVLAALACLMFAISLAIFGGLATSTAFTVLSGIIGLSAGCAGVLVATLVVDTAGAQFSGAAAGLGNALWIIGNALVPLVVGGVFQYLHSFQAALFALAAGPACSALCFLHLARLGLARRADCASNAGTVAKH